MNGNGDAFTVTEAGVYKVSFGVTSADPAQITVEVNNGAPANGSFVFGADPGVVPGVPAVSTTGTAVVTLTAGQFVTLSNNNSRLTDILLASPVGGSDASLNAWILIEKVG